MTRRSILKASDHDREHVAERLRRATAEGRLLTDELEERLGGVFSARTYGELDAVVADLPAEHATDRAGAPLWVKAGLALALVLAVLAVLAMAVLVLLGLAGAWVVWLFLAWAFFGGGGRGCRRGHSRRRARALRSAGARAGVPGGRPATFL